MHVARNMRADDAAEIFATRWNTCAHELADDCMACAPFAWAAIRSEPVAVFGAVAAHPGVWSVWMFATDDWPHVGLEVTYFMKRVMFPALIDTGAHRIFCESISTHSKAHSWLERAFGAKKEAAHPGFGRRRETFYTFAWTDPAHVQAEN